MTYQSYVQRQKDIIRGRHSGETYLLQQGEVIRLSDSDRIFNELEHMKGLKSKETQSTARSYIAADGYECNI